MELDHFDALWKAGIAMAVGQQPAIAELLKLKVGMLHFIMTLTMKLYLTWISDIVADRVGESPNAPSFLPQNIMSSYIVQNTNRCSLLPSVVRQTKLQVHPLIHLH